MNVTYDDIVNAQKVQDDVIRKTSLVFSDTFSQLTGSKVYLKNEFEQKTGSFKLRGAYYKIKNLTEDEKNKGVVAASAGNHAQGIALASAMEKINCTIVMPRSEEHTSELQPQAYLVCRLLLEKKKTTNTTSARHPPHTNTTSSSM